MTAHAALITVNSVSALGLREVPGFLQVTGREKGMIFSGSMNILPVEIDEKWARHVAARLGRGVGYGSEGG